eukprot:NODE_9160_length_380_cov_19.163142_g8260_i0.p2 GENE.NODE_9160_length_380_cov_19.163142_g8260_i0~~NODE_9160_length_380_cov_19.163142_g8260_i0.p2  ORF type:complete len:80 (+),score=24.63 NODE_9160_length_380_cov_19.163142_g8260_i0:37-240(+)
MMVVLSSHTVLQYADSSLQITIVGSGHDDSNAGVLHTVREVLLESPIMMQLKQQVQQASSELDDGFV